MTVNYTTGGALASAPLWLPSLHKVSETAAEFVPIFGCLVAAAQIIYTLRKTYQLRKDRG